MARPHRALGSLATTLGIALAYVATAKLGLLLAVSPGYATAVWPPSGIALGALLVYGRRRWPAVWLGSFVVNLTTGGASEGPLGRAACLAAAIALGAVIQSVIGARLIERFASSPRPLARERDVFPFFALGGPLSCLCSASWGVGALHLARAIPLEACAYSWWTWWVGDTIGVLIFAPLTVMWLGRDPQWKGGRRAAVSAPLAITFAAAILLFEYARRTAPHESLITWFVLAGGLIVCALVGAGALVLTGRTAAVGLLVQERTAELARANGKLAREVERHLRTTQALEQERSYLKAVLDNLSEGIVVLGPRGETTLTNEAARTMQRLLVTPEQDPTSSLSYGLRHSDGKTPLSPSELPTVRALRGESVRELELISAGPGRPPHILVVNCQPLRGPGGAQNGAVAVIRDITDSREAERMKSEFVATVSHELRTPLTSIRGSLRLLAAGVMGELSLAAMELVEIASRNGERLAALINDLLDMEKLNAGRLEFALDDFSLATLLRQSIELNAGYAHTHQVRLSLTQVPDGAWVHVDDSRFLQVMANLLSNAAKFSPPGCAVEVAAHARGALLRVEVRDRGPGIDAAFAPRVFARFSQADATDARAKSGTGLGLAISKALVEQMNGRIGFDSTVGEGTTFYLEFPRVDPPSASAWPPVQDDLSSAAGPQRSAR